jgi:hypothetical protein
MAEYYILEVKMEREGKNKPTLFCATGKPEIKSKEDFAIDWVFSEPGLGKGW